MFFNHKDAEQNQNHNPFFYYGGNYPGETTEPFYHSGVTEYTLRVSVSTHIGKVRGNHEDNFYLEGLYMNDIFRNDFSASYTVRSADGMTFAVFDGMGGAAYGEVASEIAVRTLRKYEKKLKYADGTRMLDQLVSSYTTEANDAICDMLTEKHCAVGGTTFSMLYFMGDAVKLYYLGDSRMYRYQSDGLTRLTRDHTVANQKVDAAIYTEEEAKHSPDQHRLTLFIGSDRKKWGLMRTAGLRCRWKSAASSCSVQTGLPICAVMKRFIRCFRRIISMRPLYWYRRRFRTAVRIILPVLYWKYCRHPRKKRPDGLFFRD